ncbi:MAG TPA: hypothetical protein VFK94_06495 [Patescibacteria group bacterium]|nr:hypothetical protein [Patescibacteria group bacterium]
MAPLDDKQMKEVYDWWINTAATDFNKNREKIKEYGAKDLEIMGVAIADHTNMATGMEQAIGFYLLGKIARAISAWNNERAPSDDTLYDITFYGMMLRRVREVGRWP